MQQPPLPVFSANRPVCMLDTKTVEILQTNGWCPHVVNYIDIEDIVDYSAALDTVLCPVGASNNWHWYITVAEDGRGFGYNNPYISLQGNCAEEGVN